MQEEPEGTAGEGAGQGEDTADAAEQPPARVLSDAKPESVALAKGPSTLVEVRQLTWELEALDQERSEVVAMRAHHEGKTAELNERFEEIIDLRTKALVRLEELTKWLNQ